MAVFLFVLALSAGLLLMAKGGDIFVDAAAKTARLLRVPPLLIGATIVSVGTTLPELLTSLTAMVRGVTSSSTEQLQAFTDVAVGNAVGSMVCNIGLIAAAGMLLCPYRAGGKAFAAKGLFLLALCAILPLFASSGGISRAEGIALLLFFLLFLAINISEARRKPPLPQSDALAGETLSAKARVFLALSLIFGAVFVAAGAIFTIESVSALCSRLGVPQRILSVTVVALGTSLPELVTAIVSARKGEGELSLGNILGANAINGTLILGLSACVAGGLALDDVTRRCTLFFALALTALLIFPVLLFRRTSRLQGLALAALYAAAMYFSCS